VLGILLASSIAIATFVILHNFDSRRVDQRDIHQSFEQAVDWMRKNEPALLKDQNTFLWWMVSEAALLSRDGYLLDLTERRRVAALSRRGENLWDDLLFGPIRSVSLNTAAQVGTGYKYMYLYALTCDETLLADRKLRRHLESSFCGPLAKTLLTDPHCITHQLIGSEFLTMRQCKVGVSVADRERLHEKLTNQLFFDPRVGDAFVQGLMVLAMTGKCELIRHAWLRSALQQQLKDGGWSGADATFRWGDDIQGITAAYHIDVSVATSNFHTTAQGLLLMAKLDSAPHCVR
jgi:hypothetical protein